MNWNGAEFRRLAVSITAPLAVMLWNAGPAAGETVTGSMAAPQTAALPNAAMPAGAPRAVDPEKDTVALDTRQGGTAAQGRAASPAGGMVRVGQGLRPDGTEIAPSEVPHPWLIRQ
ncbi:hypothetical protein [Azospirillum picis]|uniref:Uncharacterized protein n=1 Tax=Azospirillum picis TaxID=488438 RepID=A0ABU0MQP7_9PROT|nr:hypothetical protein [Azospirillum picis]MBP2301659.1 hypothetical protein [Azospirillum picis]MDQ0535518.1 hypothetical protein [Azospirillum picis]